MAVEYDCEGCGYHIYNAAAMEAPADGFCLTCHFIEQYLPFGHPDREVLLKTFRDHHGK